MTPANATGPLPGHPLRAPLLWGAAWGLIQAAAPLGFWWLDPTVVYALSLALIAAVYIGFAVADGRPKIVATEASVAGLFVVIAAAAVTGPAWLLVIGFTGQGSRPLAAPRQRPALRPRHRHRAPPDRPPRAEPVPLPCEAYIRRHWTIDHCRGTEAHERVAGAAAGKPIGPAQAASQLQTVMAIFPCARPASRWRMASGTSASG
jgi:hypothetical protein